MPGAPCGAAEARTTRLTREGRLSAISCAKKLPMEKPRRSTRSRPSASMNVSAPRAIFAIVLGVMPVVAPTPTLSKVTTLRPSLSASISGGSQLSRFPRKCWSRRSGVPAPSGVPIGVDHPVPAGDRQIRKVGVARHLAPFTRR